MQTEMPDDEVQLIANITDVPVAKVRGIIWLAEKRVREKARPTLNFPIPEPYDPCAGCGPICDRTVCPKRTVVTYGSHT